MRRNLLLLLVITVLLSCSDSPYLPTSPSDGSGTVNPINEVKEAVGDFVASDGICGPIPKYIQGSEISGIHGWWANIYPWDFDPRQSPIHPIPELFTPNQRQTPGQVAFQNSLLDEYGSGADILEYSPNPNLPDHNHWLATYFSGGSRKFFLLYEHIYGTRFRPSDGGPKDMSDSYNRKVFMEDIDFMFRNVILCNQSRYITVDRRAVIYMWSSSQMSGDFASLLEEAKAKYPVFFVGGDEDMDNFERLKSFDGIMDYSLAGLGSSLDYVSMMTTQHNHFLAWRRVLNSIQSETGKKIYLFATFQAGYDDTLVPGRSNLPLYPKTQKEMEEHARLVQLGLTRWRIYDGGPFVVFSELPEGASVIPSVPKSEQSGRYVGYGTGRIDVVKKYFGGRR